MLRFGGLLVFVLGCCIAGANSLALNRTQGPGAIRAGGKPVNTSSPFVQVQGYNFVLKGKPFYFVGFNAYWMGDRYRSDRDRRIVDTFLTNVQRLGMTVGRTWAFNKGLPRSRTEWQEDQFTGLDYMIAAAGQRNIKLILALGNLWNAYKGPEHFVEYATGSSEGKNVLHFYGDRATRDFYKEHMWMIVSRVNTITGIPYRDDPTIMAWNLMNEPRCPGCNAEEQKIHHEWMLEMSDYLRSIDPNHLISLGTEGFFQRRPENNYHLFNPGAGGECEGEDWLVLSQLPNIDFSTLHVYERHMEDIPRYSGNLKWSRWEDCNQGCYLNWFVEYMDLHEKLSINTTKKPMILEEFGATWWKTNKADRKALFQIVYDKLVASKRHVGVFAGAMFWNAAHPEMGDYDGYNVVIKESPFMTEDLLWSEEKLMRGPEPNPAPRVTPWGIIRNAATHEQLSEIGMTVLGAGTEVEDSNVPEKDDDGVEVGPPTEADQEQPDLPAAKPVPAAVTPKQPAAKVPMSAIPPTVAKPATVPPAKAITEPDPLETETTAVDPEAGAEPAAVPVPKPTGVAPAKAVASAVANATAAPKVTTPPPDGAPPTMPKTATPTKITTTVPITGTLQAATPITPEPSQMPGATEAALNLPRATLGRRLAGQSSMNPYHSRALKEQAHSLDGFRRREYRKACSRQAAKTWRPYYLEVFADMYDLDYQPAYDKTADLDMLQIIADAARRINNW